MSIRKPPHKKGLKHPIWLAFFILLFLLLAALVFYFFYFPKKALNLVLPNIEDVSRIQINLNGQKALVNISLIVENKMPFKMEIDTLKFSIILNGIKLAEEQLPMKLKLLGNAKDTIHLPINILIADLNKVILSTKNKDSTDLEASISVQSKSFIGKHTFSYHKKTRVLCPVLPEIKVLGATRGKYKIFEKSFHVNVTLMVINNGKFVDMELNNAVYYFKIKNTLYSSGYLPPHIIIKPGTVKTYTLPIEVKILHPAKLAWRVVTDKDLLNYALTVNVGLTINSYGLKHTVPVELQAAGLIELVK